MAAGGDLHRSADYGRYWASPAPTALGVDLQPGADPASARTAIERALGPSSGLEVSLASVRAARIDALAGEGLGQLAEIATLLLLAAVAAMAAALASSIWQRRPALAGLRLLGVESRPTAADPAAGSGTDARRRLPHGRCGWRLRPARPGRLPQARHRLPAGAHRDGRCVRSRSSRSCWRWRWRWSQRPGWFASRVPPSLALEER